MVQAKKLYPHNRDNYSLLNYGNRNGSQIDLLIRESAQRNALPLYMYYSVEKADVEEQIKNNLWLDEEAVRWCATCVNGGYLSLTQEEHKMLYGGPRHKLLALEILKHALKLSLSDLIFKKDSEQIMSHFNRMIIEKYPNYYMYKIENEGKFPNIGKGKVSGAAGIKHSGSAIPNYLTIYVYSYKAKEKRKTGLKRKRRFPILAGWGLLI